MALNPYRRKVTASHQRGIDDVPAQSRVPLIVGAVGLVAMLALVYSLSVMGVGSTAAQLFAWHVQSPP